MRNQLVHEQYITGAHRQRDDVACGELPVADTEAVAPVDGALTVHVRDQLQTAVVRCRIDEGDPHGDDGVRVGDLEVHLGVLVPGGDILTDHGA